MVTFEAESLHCWSHRATTGMANLHVAACGRGRVALCGRGRRVAASRGSVLPDWSQYITCEVSHKSRSLNWLKSGPKQELQIFAIDTSRSYFTLTVAARWKTIAAFIVSPVKKRTVTKVVGLVSDVAVKTRKSRSNTSAVAIATIVVTGFVETIAFMFSQAWKPGLVARCQCTWLNKENKHLSCIVFPKSVFRKSEQWKFCSLLVSTWSISTGRYCQWATGSNKAM